MIKRYQIFLSSTFQDLIEERFEVIKALLELDCIPCGMEYFPAASEDSWSYISGLIEQCDYYVCIVGGRYGSITPEGISFTQKEYQFALAKGIPTIAFIHGKPDDLPFKKTEANEHNRKKLETFIISLKDNLCKEWTTAVELGAVVSRSLTQLIKRHPRVGWIPANQTQDYEKTQELLDLTKKVRELENEVARLKGSRVMDVANLADGADTVEVTGTYEIYKDDPKSTYPSKTYARSVAVKALISWNDLFRRIAPRIAPSATDSSVKNAVGSLLEERTKSRKILVGLSESIYRCAIDDDSWDFIKVQFIALGLVLIEKEPDRKQRLLNWRLTELGRAKMFHLLAKRKPTRA